MIYRMIATAGLVFFSLLALSGCAPVAANYPISNSAPSSSGKTDSFDKIDRLYVDDHMEIITGPIFDPEAWEKHVEKKRRRAQESGLMDNFKMVNQMYYKLIDEHETGEVVFMRVGIFINPAVTATVRRGAFAFHVSHAGSDTVISDLGAIVPTTKIITSPTQVAFHDSGRRLFTMKHTLAEARPDHYPVPVYVRLPAWVRSEEVTRIELQDGWQYDGKAAAKPKKWH